MKLKANISKNDAKRYPFLFIHPGPYRESYANVPGGMAILAGILENNGIPVFIKDYMAEFLNIASLTDFIRINNIKIIAFSFMTPQSPWTYKLFKLLKNQFPDIIYICGGAHPTFMTREVLNEGFNFVFRRESEQTIISFVELLVNNALTLTEISKIKGICFLDGNQIITSGLPERITDLDSIPFPARHLFPFPQNYKPQIPIKKGNCAQFFTSRGCPEYCKFCAQPYRDGIYYRSPENVVDEIEYVKKRFNITHFYINDDNFCHNNERAIDISKLLIKRELNLTWAASFARIEPVCMEMFKEMKRSGCIAVTFGIESGDPDVRKSINKRGSIDDAFRAVNLVQKAKMIAGATFIFGHPQETYEQAKRTIELACGLNADYNKFFINTPYPGSADYVYFKKNGLLLSRSWEDYWIQDKPIIRTKYLSTENLIELKRKAFVKIHTNPRWWLRQFKNAIRIKNIGLGIRAAKNLILEFLNKGLSPKYKLLDVDKNL